VKGNTLNKVCLGVNFHTFIEQKVMLYIFDGTVVPNIEHCNIFVCRYVFNEIPQKKQMKKFNVLERNLLNLLIYRYM